MLGKLVPCGGGVPIPLLRPSLVLGRRSECDITIPCSTVSSRHCLLEFADGYWWVSDLESKNGTAVNGQRGVRMKIAPASILSVGRQRLVVDYVPTPKTANRTLGNDADEDLALGFLNEEPNGQSAISSASLYPTSDQSSSQTIPTVPSLRSNDLGKLIPSGGGIPIPLRSEELILGRGPDCDIRVRYPSVSSRHCKLKFDLGYWMVEDLHSTNGTWVDGDRCMLQCLMPDSVLALDKVRFTIQYVPRGNGSPPVVRRLFTQSLLEKAGLVNEFSGDRLGQMPLPNDESDRPKRYNLLDSENESL